MGEFKIVVEQAKAWMSEREGRTLVVQARAFPCAPTFSCFPGLSKAPWAVPPSFKSGGAHESLKVLVLGVIASPKALTCQAFIPAFYMHSFKQKFTVLICYFYIVRNAKGTR